MRLDSLLVLSLDRAEWQGSGTDIGARARKPRRRGAEQRSADRAERNAERLLKPTKKRWADDACHSRSSDIPRDHVEHGYTRS